MLPAGPIYIMYWYPLAAMAMLLTVIFDTYLALVVTTVMAGLIGVSVTNSLELTIYYAAGGMLAALTLRDAQRINTFFRAGVMASVGYITVIVIFRLNQDLAAFELLQLLLYGLANGVLSAALTLVGFYFLGSLFRVTTTLQLQDLSRLDHPLLQELLRRAPGTYHHSIMVANLAEQAADRVKAQSTLVRVGAFYHDIGKMNNPFYFTENQEGHNPHDSLDPYTSAEIIASHVTDGLELARRYKLPDRIRDFIAEHHGRRLVKGFYLKALEQAGGDVNGVEEARFRYPGPRPQSRESGIVMLADAIEAISSALRPNTEKAIEKIVTSIIQEDLREGQLNNSGLTLGDIQMIRESFIETLKGRFHLRVRYPGNEEMEEDVAADKPAQLAEPQLTGALPLPHKSGDLVRRQE
ncbi:MAG: HDIG domain-containing protein [Chloroflexi bacterium]|nr:HDIG domain-containing protein [Chloroflexota bacterium]